MRTQRLYCFILSCITATGVTLARSSPAGASGHRASPRGLHVQQAVARLAGTIVNAASGQSGWHNVASGIASGATGAMATAAAPFTSSFSVALSASQLFEFTAVSPQQHVGRKNRLQEAERALDRAVTLQHNLQVQRYRAAVALQAQQAAAQQAAQRAAYLASVAAQARQQSNAAQVVAPAAPSQATGSVWAALRNCESGGNYADNTGNGYYGAYQFSLGTWRSLGFSGLPSNAPPAVQDAAARQLQARSGWGQWPVCSVKIGA